MFSWAEGCPPPPASSGNMTVISFLEWGHLGTTEVNFNVKKRHRSPPRSQFRVHTYVKGFVPLYREKEIMNHDYFKGNGHQWASPTPRQEQEEKGQYEHSDQRNGGYLAVSWRTLCIRKNWWNPLTVCLSVLTIKLAICKESRVVLWLYKHISQELYIKVAYKVSRGMVFWSMHIFYLGFSLVKCKGPLRAATGLLLSFNFL